MGALSNYLENMVIDGLFRGGALGSGGAVNSTAVIKGVWTATTAYVVGDVVTPHAGMTGAGGKFLRCTTAGTSGSTTTLAVPAVGSTLSDGTATWTAVSGVPSFLSLYVGMIVATKGQRANSTAYSLNDTIYLTANDGLPHLYKCTTAGTSAAAQGTLYPGTIAEIITDGTAVFTEQSTALDANTSSAINEPTIGVGSYARVAVAASLSALAGTQSSSSTTTSTGTSGTTSNNAAVTFPAPTSNWASGFSQVAGIVVYDQASSGNLLFWGLLTIPKTINNGDQAPSFAISALSFQIDS